MENKKRYFVIGGISACLIIIAIIVVIVCNRPNNINIPEKQENNTLQINESEKLASPRKYEELDVITAKLMSTDKSVEFEIEVKNNTDEEVLGHTIQFTMIDEDGNELGKMTGYLSTIKPGETSKVHASASGNMVMSAYDYKMEKR